MKFGRQIEEYQLPEWKGQYFPYTTLKKRLPLIKDEFEVPSTPHSIASFAPAKTWFGTLTQEPPSPMRSPIACWRHDVMEEAKRIAACVNYGVEGLEIQLEEVVEMMPKKKAKTGMENTASSESMKSREEIKKEKYLEIRVLESLKRVHQALSRLRGFADLNHAAVYKILKKHDKQLKSTEGLQVIFPDIIKITGLGDNTKLDQLEAAIKSEFKGLGSTPPDVQMYAAGLGTMGAAAMLNTKDQSDAWNKQLLCFFLGASVMSYFFLAVFLFVLPARLQHTYSIAYLLSSFATFRVPFSVMLCMAGMGLVSRMCDNASINHMFLMDVDPRCHVQDKFLFQMAAMLNTAWVFIFGLYVLDYKWMVLLPLFQDASQEGGFNSRSSWHFVLYPTLLLFATLYVVFLRRSSVCRFRYKLGLLKSVGRFLMAPFVPVNFGDNVVGDVLTSLAKPLQDIPIAMCYLFSHHPQTQEDIIYFSRHGNTCPEWVVPVLLPIIAALPYWLRLMQCLRRYYDSRDKDNPRGDTKNLWNGGKYFVSLMVVVVTAWTSNPTAVIPISMTATLYCSFWDVFIDWGLSLQDLVFSSFQSNQAGDGKSKLPPSHSQNSLDAVPEEDPMSIGIDGAVSGTLSKGLEKLNLLPKSGSSRRDAAKKVKRSFSPQFYRTCAVLDVVARCSWVLTLAPLQSLSDSIEQRALLNVLLSTIEIARRSVWAVIRMENEQLSNASGFRALLWVPMKMNQEEDFDVNIRLKVQASSDNLAGATVKETAAFEDTERKPSKTLSDSPSEPLLDKEKKDKKDKKDKKEKKKKDDDDSDSD